eukprot:scaffold22923_cov36-Phaeocystis_antarctica.AAC.1
MSAPEWWWRLVHIATRRAPLRERLEEGESLRGSGTHHHLRQRVLRLERELDPRGPRFENAGLWRKGGEEVQPQGNAIA